MIPIPGKTRSLFPALERHLPKALVSATALAYMAAMLARMLTATGG